MATQYHNLSDYDSNTMPDASAMKVGIVVAEWNYDITSKLLGGALKTLTANGVKPTNIVVNWVPGSFELVFGARILADGYDLDAVIVLGCVIRGDTPHFEYVCSGVTQGITQLNLTEQIPFIFGLLTNDTMQQSIDRAGGILGNKGDEAAVTAIKMAALNRSLR
ncbi:MAG TPA: 6,7-dimethyl-8-ribityllumazine synthase [Bacteroidales bacterium]|nr:6,7-dimethyl-8-ribityllumazine synthase [Bacteroidales bacterium]